MFCGLTQAEAEHRLCLSDVDTEDDDLPAELEDPTLELDPPMAAFGRRVSPGRILLTVPWDGANELNSSTTQPAP